MSAVIVKGLNAMIKKLTQYRGKLETTQKDELLRLGNTIRRDIEKEALLSPRPGLKKSTVRIKRAKGAPFPTRTWYETGLTIPSAFAVRTRELKSGDTTLRVVTKRTRHPKHGVPYSDLVTWLERGKVNQEARPVVAKIEARIRTDNYQPLKEYKKRVASILK
jgi:hypothetical protein